MTLLLPPVPATPPGGQGPAEPWRPRTDADLLSAQLRALDAWHARFAVVAAGIPGQSREARLDDARRRDLAQREREALATWAERAMHDDYPFGRGSAPRAVIAHRNGWLRDKVQSGLQDHDVAVVLSTGDGAEAAAAIVMEQPDLVFVEDLLPSLSGLDVIERTRMFAPDALIGAHALGQSGMSPLLDAGARAAFSRRIPPAQIATELVACLHGDRSVVTLV